MLLGESSFLPSSIPAAGVEVLLLAMELTTFEEITHVSLVMKLFPLIIFSFPSIFLLKRRT